MPLNKNEANKRLIEKINAVEESYPRDFSNTQKILLTTDGSITAILDVLYGKITLSTLEQHFEDATEETAKLVAQQIGSEQEDAYSQRGDARWLTGREVSKGVEDGTVYEYYELQRKGFEETDESFKNKSVNDYVVFDIMTDAAEYK